MIKFKSACLNDLMDLIVNTYLDSLKINSRRDSQELRNSCIAFMAKHLEGKQDAVFVILLELLKEMLDSEMDNTTQGKTVN